MKETYYCGTCGNPVERYASSMRGKQQVFCSKECLRAYRKLHHRAPWLTALNTEPGRNAAIARATAEKRGDALRGRGSGKSYRKRNGRHEHRVVMEELLDRPLTPEELVHHDNENKQDNRPENLILTDRVEHGKIHNPKGTKKGGKS